LYDWLTRLGLGGITPDELAPFFAEIERDMSVETVPESMRSRSTELFVEGAAQLGIPMKSLRRNTSGCKGASRCNFGCPHGAKMSVDISMFPDAWAHGAVIVSDALVEKVVVESGIARGVRGRFMDARTGEPGVAFETCAHASS
jgi:choline dehydrogenase-like flavoprotein